jgi:hypothetical protein
VDVVKGKRTPTPLPVITAGEAIRHTWCGICLEPWRIRVPLYADGQPCGGLEVCMGCGATHDKPGVYITPHDPDAPAAPAPAVGPRAPLLPRLASALHARACKRRGLRACECAYGDCPWPGLWRLAFEMDGDEGHWSYLFCRKSHRARWAEENGVVL